LLYCQYMKDKRTYTNYKEHGEDISHENEIVIDFVEAKQMTL